jgi:chromate reductase
MLKIAVVVGSLRKDSMNKKLAQALGKLAAGKMEFQFIEIGDLPLFNQDLEASVPASVTKFKTEIESADGVLFVTPEYNRSIPGVLKNAIDWGSRPYGKSSWSAKPAAICGTSPGAIGTAVAQAHLRSITAGFLNMPTMGQPEMYFQWKDGLIDADGTVTNDDTKKFLQGFVDKFAAHVAANAAAAAKAAA